MARKDTEANRIELLQGTLDMLILRTLQWGPQHGHGVGQAIRQSSAELLQIERGSLYPALHRLEARGLISSENTRKTGAVSSAPPKEQTCSFPVLRRAAAAFAL